MYTVRSSGQDAGRFRQFRCCNDGPHEAELLLADAASFQHNLAKRNADEVPQVLECSHAHVVVLPSGSCEAWEAFTRYITEVMGKKQTLNVSNSSCKTDEGPCGVEAGDARAATAQEFLQDWLEGDCLR